jgi:hypothetical protein
LGVKFIKTISTNQLIKGGNQLDYPVTEPCIKEKVEILLMDPNEMLVVFEEDKNVIVLISIHFIPQLAVKGDFARISYFAVDKNIRSKGIERISIYVIMEE